MVAGRVTPVDQYLGSLHAAVDCLAAVDVLVDVAVDAEKDSAAARSHFVIDSCPGQFSAGDLGMFVLDIVAAADVAGLGRHDDQNAGIAADGVAAAAAVVVESEDDCSIGVACYARQGQ
jgi:hypothetical protein